jgi:hypothetical protein
MVVQLLQISRLAGCGLRKRLVNAEASREILPVNICWKDGRTLYMADRPSPEGPESPDLRRITLLNTCLGEHVKFWFGKKQKQREGLQEAVITGAGGVVGSLRHCFVDSVSQTPLLFVSSVLNRTGLNHGYYDLFYTLLRPRAPTARRMALFLSKAGPVNMKSWIHPSQFGIVLWRPLDRALGAT